LLQPFDILSIKRFLNCDVSHRVRFWRSVPVLEPWRKPHHIAWTHSLGETALALNPTKSGHDQKGLTERVRMPSGTRAGACSGKTGSIRTVPVNHSAGPLREGSEPLRLISIAMFILPAGTSDEAAAAPIVPLGQIATFPKAASMPRRVIVMFFAFCWSFRALPDEE
jgi:hypothetical protein